MTAIVNSTLMQIGEAPRIDGWFGDKLWRLYVPVQNGQPTPKVTVLFSILNAKNLATVVPISLEDYESNLQFLRQCVDTSTIEAEPYLEVTVSGCSAMVLHYRGDEIVRTLSDLSRQLDI